VRKNASSIEGCVRQEFVSDDKRKEWMDRLYDRRISGLEKTGRRSQRPRPGVRGEERYTQMACHFAANLI
jgi:hypothetical protein